MISVIRIDHLAGALASDAKFQQAFLADRISAINDYNTRYIQRFGGKLIELSEEEKLLITSIQATSIEEFYELLELELDRSLAATHDFALKSPTSANSANLSQTTTSAA